MKPAQKERLVTFEPTESIWDKFFTVSPLVVVGTREEEGGYTLAPKHLAMPMGWQNYFGFVCTPRHRTYQNIKQTGVFTVSYPRPEQVEAVAALAGPRAEGGRKPALDQVDTFPAQEVDGVLLEGGCLFVECRLDRIVDRLGENSLLIGGVAAVHVSEEALRGPEAEDPKRLEEAPLLAYLNPGRYTTVQESEAFPFPEAFDSSKAYPTEAGFAEFGK